MVSPSHGGDSVVHATDIIQSPADQCHYQALTLANGLRCCLVHSPEAQHSAAAMAVATGHFDDPEDAQGLAHFLEHMLFLGTEGYPAAEDYQNFIANHGGGHNAWTGTELSNYYFHILPEYFGQALDRFCRFFYQPLLHPDWVAKELESIDAEFHLKRQDELRRLYQVHKSTVNQAHPFAKFSVGNRNTLSDRPDRPLAQQLRDFFQSNYQAQWMTLVLVGPHSLAELQQLALQYGEEIPGQPERVKPAIDVPLYLPEQLAARIQMRPLKDVQRLIISFALPSIDADYAHKTTSFIAHILGYEGPGSLFSLLRERQWIVSLAAGGGISGSNFKDFNINMQLTDEGLAHIDDIIAEVLAYIRLIDAMAIEEWRYQERQNTIAQAFRYQERSRSKDLAPALAVNLQQYKLEDVVFGDYRMDGLNHSFARQILQLMTPDNMRTTVIHKQVETDQIEPIYGSEYSFSPLSNDSLARFRAISASDSQARLPQANPYTGQLRPLHPVKRVQSVPELTVINSKLRHWHLQEAEFRVPRAHLYLSFRLPAVTATARSFALARLWCELLLDYLSESCYDAEVAGLHYNIYPQQQGITIHISGLSSGVATLSQQLLITLQNATFSPHRFHVLRQKLAQNWRSALASRPLNLLFSKFNVLVQPNTFAVCQLAEELAEIDLADYQQWRSQLFNEVAIESFSCGDIITEELHPVLEQIQQLTAAAKLAPLAQLDARGLAELQAQDFKVCEGLRQTHPDSALILAIQGEQTELREQALFLLFNHLVNSAFFHQLRTEKQLGYLVGTSYLPIQQRPHLLFYVQSSNTDTEQLTTAVEHFLADFQLHLQQFDADQLASAQQAIRLQLLEPDTNLRLRAQRFWSSITQADTDFARLNQLAEALEHLTPKDLQQFFNTAVLQTTSRLYLKSEPTALTAVAEPD
ncbi:insulinase family protein [Pseudidiomarina taiwanensis]|nr:insulinase family protein [Pseudidiomarina taiwanensis]